MVESKKNANECLVNKKCMPCTGSTPRMKGHEIKTFYQQLEPGWKVVEDRHLEKEYLFPDFKQGLRFTNDLGKIAEEEGHHPDILLTWGKVKVILWTHKINGLSESDFIFASKCDRQYAKDHISHEF